MKKRVFSMLLVIVMVISQLPTAALTAEGTPLTSVAQELSGDYYLTGTEW